MKWRLIAGMGSWLLIVSPGPLPAAEVRPPSFPTVYLNGLDSLRRADYPSALGYFDETIRLQPAFAAGYNARGRVLLEMKRYTEAISDFTTAIQIEPDNHYAYLGRAIAQSRQGDDQKALADAKTANRLLFAELRRETRLPRLQRPSKRRQDLHRRVPESMDEGMMFDALERRHQGPFLSRSSETAAVDSTQPSGARKIRGVLHGDEKLESRFWRQLVALLADKCPLTAIARVDLICGSGESSHRLSLYGPRKARGFHDGEWNIEL